MSAPAKTTTRIGEAAISVLVGVMLMLSACGQEPKPEWLEPPDSPVGHFETQLHTYLGERTNADGKKVGYFRDSHDLTIDVRADHTFRYEWKSLRGPGEKDGSLEGTWRSDPESKDWLFRQAGDAGAERSVSFVQGEMIRPGEPLSGKTWVPGQWAFPTPDTATGKLMDSYLFILWPPK